jgi:hypothetical protein
MARKAATPRDDLLVIALRAALVAIGAALCVLAWGQVFAFFKGGIGMAGYLFPRPTAGFWRVAALAAVFVVVPASIVERAALRRRLAGRGAALAALAAGAFAWPATLVAAIQLVYLRHALAGDPTAGYAKALAWVTAELAAPPRVLVGEALALSAPVALVVLARVHRLPLAPTFAGVTSTSALVAALALGLITRQHLRLWLVESPVLWEAIAAAALLPLAYAAVDRLDGATRRVAAPQAALPPPARG